MSRKEWRKVLTEPRAAMIDAELTLTVIDEGTTHAYILY